MMVEGKTASLSFELIDSQFIFTGLYLYLLVVETFSRIEVINKFIIYAVIGYGKVSLTLKLMVSFQV